MKTFWLIRHGQSASNAGIVTENAWSTPLTERGRQEAQIMADTFTRSPTLIVTSSYTRTQQTAEPTIARFPDVPQQQWPIHEFNSLSPSKYIGSTAQIRRPQIYEYWRRNDPHFKDEGDGESFAEVMTRVVIMFGQLQGTTSQFSAIFAHGIFNSLVMWYWLNHESTELAIARMRYFPLFRTGFNTRNCSYIKGTVEGKKISLSALQQDHLPSYPDGKSNRLGRTLASYMVKRRIGAIGKKKGK